MEHVSNGIWFHHMGALALGEIPVAPVLCGYVSKPIPLPCSGPLMHSVRASSGHAMSVTLQTDKHKCMHRPFETQQTYGQDRIFLCDVVQGQGAGTS